MLEHRSARARRLRAPAQIRLLLATALLGICPALWAAPYPEDAVKAAFLYRFAAYVDWPGAPSTAPFTIAVVGADGVATQLEQLIAGLPPQTRTARVAKLAENDSLTDVQVLYLGPRAGRVGPRLLAKAAAQPILVVTDDERGLVPGAVINFVRIGSNVRFEVSLTAAERSGLKINAGLLSVAARVEGRPQAGSFCPSPVIHFSCGSRYAGARHAYSRAEPMSVRGSSCEKGTCG